MINPPAILLLVEAETLDAARIREVLAGVGLPAFHIESVRRCADALSSLERGAVDVILLDLALLDGWGPEVLERVRAAAPDALILVLSAATNEAMARAAPFGVVPMTISSRITWMPIGCQAPWTISSGARRPGTPCGAAKPASG